MQSIKEETKDYLLDYWEFPNEDKKWMPEDIKEWMAEHHMEDAKDKSSRKGKTYLQSCGNGTWKE